MSKAKLKCSVFLKAMCFRWPSPSSSTSTKRCTAFGATAGAGGRWKIACAVGGASSSPSVGMIIAMNVQAWPPTAIMPCGTDER